MMLPATPVLPTNMMAPADIYAAFSPRSLGYLGQDDGSDDGGDGGDGGDGSQIPALTDTTTPGVTEGTSTGATVAEYCMLNPTSSLCNQGTLVPATSSSISTSLAASAAGTVSIPVNMTPTDPCVTNPSLCSQVSIPSSGISLTSAGTINTNATDATTTALIAAAIKQGLTLAQIATLGPGMVLTQQPNGTVTVSHAAGGVTTPLGTISTSGSGGLAILAVVAIGLIAFSMK